MASNLLIRGAIFFILFVIISDRVMVYFGVSFGGSSDKEGDKVIDPNSMVIKVLDQEEGGTAQDGRPAVIDLHPENETRYPILVWWTPFTGHSRIVHRCSLGSCLFTHSRRELHNPLTKGVMFYGSSIEWNDLPLPRSQNHLWNLIHEESPKNDFLLATPEAMSLFNYTATCSRHSSYPLVSQYLISLDHILTPVKYPPSEKSKDGRGLVMYLHSDCGVPSDRDSYASILMKYVQVDSYGSCVNNRQLPEHLRDPVKSMDSEELYDIIGQYKFILSFENAICEDYITEKLWRSFEAGTVPIYKGSPSVKDWLPDADGHSVILADDFASPEELAKHLIFLDQNDDEYMKYFAYKGNGITNARLIEHMSEREWFVGDGTSMKLNFIEGFECHVCNQIHKRKKQAADNNGQPLPIQVANGSHYNYSNIKASVRIRNVQEQVRHPGYNGLTSWKYTYECGIVQARGIVPIIQRGGSMDEVRQELFKGCRNFFNIPKDWLVTTE